MNEDQPAAPQARQSPLDTAVAEILKAPQFLTGEHIVKLRAIMPKDHPVESGNRSAGLLLQNSLERFGRLLKDLEMSIQGTKSVDDIKSLLGLTRDMYNMMTKSLTVSRMQEEMAALELSITEVLRDMNEEDLRKFMASFRKRLDDISRKDG